MIQTLLVLAVFLMLASSTPAIAIWFAMSVAVVLIVRNGITPFTYKN